MNLKFLDLKSSNSPYFTEIKSAVNRVIESGWFIRGEECEQFEIEFASYCTSKYCVGVGNGLDV